MKIKHISQLLRHFIKYETTGELQMQNMSIYRIVQGWVGAISWGTHKLCTFSCFLLYLNPLRISSTLRGLYNKCANAKCQCIELFKAELERLTNSKHSTRLSATFLVSKSTKTQFNLWQFNQYKIEGDEKWTNCLNFVDAF